MRIRSARRPASNESPHQFPGMWGAFKNRLLQDFGRGETFVEARGARAVVVSACARCRRNRSPRAGRDGGPRRRPGEIVTDRMTDDIYARWRLPRQTTLTIAALPPSPYAEGLATPILKLVGHLPGLAISHEINKEIGTYQSLIPFYVAQLPDRYQTFLAPGQQYLVTMHLTSEARWDIDWSTSRCLLA